MSDNVSHFLIRIIEGHNIKKLIEETTATSTVILAIRKSGDIGKRTNALAIIVVNRVMTQNNLDSSVEQIFCWQSGHVMLAGVNWNGYGVRTLLSL